MPNTQYTDARRILVDDLRRFMVGPHHGEKDEVLHAGTSIYHGAKNLRVINETPYNFYHTGFLCPPDTSIDEEEDDQEDQGSDVDTGTGESVMNMANASQQSAMGMTFQIADLSIPITLRLEWGRYELKEGEPVVKGEPLGGEDGINEDEDREQESNGGTGESKRVDIWWQRRHEEIQETFYPSAIENGASAAIAVHEGVELHVRRREHGGLQFLTVSAINRNRYKKTNRKKLDPRAYQVRMSAESLDGQSVFSSNLNTARRKDNDFWQQELLYRNARQFAVGHGCAVMWEEGDDGRARRIWTEWIPECEVKKASAAVLDEDSIFELEKIADPTNKVETLRSLRTLSTDYGEWISCGIKKIPEIAREFTGDAATRIASVASGNLDKCESQRARIEEGINYLEQHDIAYEAFCLANKSMEVSMRKKRPEHTPKWFPFQLAFILITIPSLSDPGDRHRDTLDLIWFPTGGGKTEAYLGLSAFSLFYRGLSANDPREAGGTAIITRYTLRTLTVQQFERTTLAIMACESVRREHPVLRSHEPWSIGLLVGSGATPKWLFKKKPNDKSAENLLGHGEFQRLLPLKKCPWCESELGSSQLELLVDKSALLTRCSNKQCEFSNEIPIRIVDEHLVNMPPSFVVATIDKFAQLAWEPDLAVLLGRNTPALPPNLIIQDELHLITDALGTIAALYETAIDILASHNNIGPKIVGATATIRRAEEQVRSLFLRNTELFPPSGLVADDSFFYREDKSAPGRLYLGIHAQGRSPKHTLPRILGTLAQSAPTIKSEKIRDTYWTIVTYFNSLRELGGALVVAEDDTPSYQRSLANIEKTEVRRLSQKVEMTSQVPSERIYEILDELNVGLLSDSESREPIDMLLATSMISVGVDVDRLGLMVIAGQPKTTAEYIQASSRVGRPRGSAGLVITQYNWTRPRDRSHYERFLPYHQSFYRFVEAVSVTPFSPRARDRALGGVITAMARVLVPELQNNEISNPANIAVRLRELMKPVCDAIISRVERVDAKETDHTINQLEGLLEQLEDFLTHNSDSPKFWTRWRVGGDERRNGDFMLQTGMNPTEYDSPWVAMLSMRDTDAPSLLRLVYRERNDR